MKCKTFLRLISEVDKSECVVWMSGVMGVAVCMIIVVFLIVETDVVFDVVFIEV